MIKPGLGQFTFNNLIVTTKCNDSLILIRIISWDYLNLSLANEYIGDVTIPTRVIKYNQCCSTWFSQSDCSIHIKLNYLIVFRHIALLICFYFISGPLNLCRIYQEFSILLHYITTHILAATSEA